MSTLITSVSHVGPVSTSASKFLRKMTYGAQPPLIECCKGDYVVKSMAQGLKVFANELVGGLLALLVLGLSSPAPAIVHSAQDIMDPTQQHVILPAGVHFGSQYMETDGAPVNATSVRQASNFSDLPKIMALDLWTANMDRHEHNLIISKGWIYPIDHSQILTGPSWTIQKLKDCTTNISQDWMMKNLVSPDSLAEAVKKIETLDAGFIASVVGAVPIEWGLLEEERSAAVEFLVARQALLRLALNR